MLPNDGIKGQRKIALDALVKYCSNDFDNAMKIANEVLAQKKVRAAVRAILNGIKNCTLTEYEQTYL